MTMEVAGVVLGAWPIVTAGLGRYRKDVKKLKRAAHYDTEVDEWIRSVKFQKIYFHDNMLELLNAVSPGATGILDVADSYREELWSGTVASDCHDYLRPERYALFRELSEGFESCLLELATELDRVQRKPKRKKSSNNSQDPPSLADLKSLAIRSSESSGFFTKRAQFLIREEDVSRLTNELNRLNESMAKLLTHRRNLHQRVESRNSADPGASCCVPALADLLQQVRNHADRLFDAFHRSWAAGCHKTHEAMIYLDTPAASEKTKKINLQASSSKFRVLVRGKPGENPCLQVPNWHETTVTVEEVNKDQWGPAQLHPQHRHPVPQIVTPTSTGLSATQAGIDNLCQIIMQARNVQKSLDLILHDTFASRDAGQWSASLIAEDASCCKIITLEQLVLQRKLRRPSSKVSVALKLAASLLQFKTTRWLQAWTNTTIRFFSHGSQHPFDVEAPLISQNFDAPVQGHTDGSRPLTGVPLSQTSRDKPRSMIFALGVLLMEIWTGRTYKDWLSEYKQKYPDDMEEIEPTELALAWHQEAYSEMTVRYGQVVLTCLNFEFGLEQARPSWDDRDLRVAMCAKVIQPLREECETFPRRRVIS